MSTLAQYIDLRVETVHKVFGEESLENVTKIGLHRCSEEDKQFFGPFVDLNMKGIEQIWTNLLCIDNVD